MDGAGGRVLTVLAVLTLTGAATLPVKSTDKAQQFVDKCRSHCIAELTPDANRETCLEGEQCLRCWAACKAFQSDHFIRDYCKRNKACTAGCRQACLFYLGQSDRRPVGSGQTLTEALAGSGQTITAPLAGSGQTITALPVVIGLDRGPVFEPESTVYSFVDGQRRPWDGEDAGAIGATVRRPVKAGWRPRLAGMAFAASLVSATVSWPPRSPGGQYLVTWELLSGGLRGHLVSEETTASLPLWPDAQYLVQVFCDEGASQPLQLDTHQPSEAARGTASEKTRDTASEEATKKASEATPEEGREKTTVPDVGTTSYSHPASRSVDSDSVNSYSVSDSDSDSVSGSGPVSNSESAEVTKSAVAARLKSSQVESSSAGERAAVLTPASPLESAALLTADSDLDSSSELTRPASLLSGPTRRGRLPTASRPLPLTLPTLLTLLTLLILLLAAGLILAGRACLRPQKPCSQHCHQHQQEQQQQQQWRTTKHEASTNDRRTLLDRRPSPWRTSPLPQVLVDSRRAPLFVVPCHKR